MFEGLEKEIRRISFDDLTKRKGKIATIYRSVDGETVSYTGYICHFYKGNGEICIGIDSLTGMVEIECDERIEIDGNILVTERKEYVM